MADTDSYSKLVPGFEFMQNLVKTAGAALPGIGQWVAPTLDPQELDKRIEELRTVQFWLEQNARMLGATIQALEVQRMTLSTLQTMNVQMDDLRESMTLRMPGTGDEPGARDAAPAGATAPPAKGAPEREARTATPDAGAQAGATGGVDPMQWWSALTKQFAQLAASAMKQGATAVSPGIPETREAAGRPSAGADGGSRPASPGGSSGPARSRKAGKPAGQPARKAAPKKRSSTSG